MPFLPSDPFALAAMAVIGGGIIALGRRDVPKAYTLGVMVLFVFALQFASGVFGDGRASYQLGFQTNGLLDGKWWSPLTAMFVHSPVDLLHIFGNMFLLVAVGPALEERIGDRRFLLVYFAAGIVGFIAHAVLSFVVPNVVGPEQTALGASGAIFGILTTYAVRYPRNRIPVILPGIFFILRLPAFLVLLIFLGFNLVYLLSDATGGFTGIAWWGHFAGFLVGLPFAYTLPATHETVPTGTRGLPDASKLEPLATTPELRQILEKVRQFNPETRTSHDAEFATAWLDRFFEKARCTQCGAPFTRKGLRATCANGETTVEFARE